MGFFSEIGDVFGDVFGGITGATQQAEAIGQAGELSAQASREGIEESKRRFDRLVSLMSPFVETGTRALELQSALAGAGPAGSQEQAISQIKESPLFKALRQQGEQSILQSASATGGLRGGNVNEALAQFSPALLNQLINQRFSQLSSISSMGQAAAAGQAGAGMQVGTDISNLLQNIAGARGGGIIAAGGVPRQAFGDILEIGGTIVGAKKAGMF